MFCTFESDHKQGLEGGLNRTALFQHRKQNISDLRIVFMDVFPRCLLNSHCCGKGSNFNLYFLLKHFSEIFLSLEIKLIFEAGRHIKCKNDNLRKPFLIFISPSSNTVLLSQHHPSQYQIQRLHNRNSSSKLLLSII